MTTSIERHVATVSSNNDPEKRGRIRVTCPGLMGDDETPLAGFVEPALDWGVFVVPDVGEVVEIEVTVSSARDESFKQSAIDQLNPRWRGARFYDAKADSPITPVHHDFTSKNYGKRRGIATPTGHTIVFDDTEGSESLRVSWRNRQGKLQFFEISDDTVTISIDGGATLELKGKDGSTTSKTGDGAKHVAIVEALQNFYLAAIKTTLEATYNPHLHPSAMGPTGPPAQPLVMPAWDATINSTKVSIPDG